MEVISGQVSRRFGNAHKMSMPAKRIDNQRQAVSSATNPLGWRLNSEFSEVGLSSEGSAAFQALHQKNFVFGRNRQMAGIRHFAVNGNGDTRFD